MCSGDCALTEWSTWSSCNCRNQSRSRTRRIKVQPVPSGRPCGPLHEESHCACAEYNVNIGKWTSCQLPQKASCGRGQQDRVLNCVDKQGIIVAAALCNDLQDMPAKRTCHVTCPVDCQLSHFTRWSTCSSTCGNNGTKTRSQGVLRQANEYGVKCPPAALRSQVTRL